MRPGAIVDEGGAVVGEHDGIAMYTVGQRSGLRLQASGPATAPRYVSAIDTATNTVRVGGPEQLLRTTCRVEDVRYVGGMMPSEVVVCLARDQERTAYFGGPPIASR